MKKIVKFALVLLSTLGLILGTTTTSFSKVEGDRGFSHWKIFYKWQTYTKWL